MAKMPKNLSMSRPRSSSGSMSSQDWQHRTTERSGSSIIAAMIRSGPRVPESRKTSKREQYYIDKKTGERKPKDIPGANADNSLDAKIEIIIHRIRREEMRVKKMKAMGTPPIGRETQEDKDRAAKILRKEAVINGLHFQLQNLNSEKQSIDAREESKRINKIAVESGVLVKLEKDYVPVGENRVTGKAFIPDKTLVPTQMIQSLPGKKKKKVLITDRQAGRLIKAEIIETKAKERAERQERLKRLSMADLVRQEKLGRFKEKMNLPEETKEEIREVFGEDDFEKMFEE